MMGLMWHKISRWGCSEPKLINMGFTSIHICKGSEINVHDTVFGDKFKKIKDNKFGDLFTYL